MQRVLQTRKLAALAFLFLSICFAANASYIPAKAFLARELIEKAWEQTLATGQFHRPWSWADHWPLARLVFAEKGVDKLILAGTEGASLAFAPGAMS